MGVSRKHSSLLSSSVPPRPLSRHSVSEAGSMSISTKDADASWPSPARRCNQQSNYRRISERHTHTHADSKVLTAADGQSTAVGANSLGVENLFWGMGGEEKMIQTADCTGMSMCWSLLTHYDNCVPTPARKIRHMVEGAKNGPWHGGAYL